MTPRTEAGIVLATVPGRMVDETPLVILTRDNLIKRVVKVENEAFEAGRLAGRAEAEGKEQTS